MLDTQYRMHPSLIDFLSKVFYNDLSKSDVTSELGVYSSRSRSWALTIFALAHMSAHERERAYKSY
jgi:hypothetical protein